MVSSEVQRKLVKSAPELWAQLSDPTALARHLGALGEIRITKTMPEQSVEWEAEAAQGRVDLEQSGWGTKVTLTIRRELAQPPAAVACEASDRREKQDPPLDGAAEPEPRLGLLARILRRRPGRRTRADRPAAGQPEHPPQRETDLGAAAAAKDDLQAESGPQAPATDPATLEREIAERDAQTLNDVLDRLGSAHHRPFSRS